MRLARHIALDNDTPCSRKVGSVIVDSDNIVRGLGYNASPRQTQHCDSTDYIRDILWPKLDENDKAKLCNITLAKAKENPALFDCDIRDLENLIESKYPLIQNAVANVLGGCNTCPRRLLGYPAGQRTDLCSCQHAESNSIVNSNGPVNGCILFGWCCISCFQCTGQIINSRIAEVHFLEGEEYQSGCLAMYKYAKIPVFLHSEGSING